MSNVLLMITHQNPEFALKMQYQKADLNTMTHVAVFAKDKSCDICKVEEKELTLEEKRGMFKVFTFRHY